MIFEPFLGVIIDICIVWGIATLFCALGLLLADTMNAGSRIDVVVHSPVRPLPTIGERARHFFKTWIQR
jgi:hypothetical protein